MLNCNYYIAVADNKEYAVLLELLKTRYENLQIFFDKESLIKSVEFLSQSQSYLDNNIFVVFAETQQEAAISKYLRENLDDLNYILISFGTASSTSPKPFNNVFDFMELSGISNAPSLIFNRLDAEIARRSRMTALKLQIREFYEIGKMLSSERDIFKLFDMIIATSLKITSSDAVTLYLVADKTTGEWASIENNDCSNKVMKFVISKNMSISTDFQSFSIPITKKSITGYTALNGKSLRIDDAYNISPEMEYKHDNSFDRLTGYRTISMLSVPMKDRNNNIAGVIQLINKKTGDSFADFRDEIWKEKIIPFDYFDELTMNSIAGQAAVALENNLLYKNINQLLLRYVEQNEKLTVLSGKILKAHEEERKRIAREIHDGPAQTVACLALRLELCKKQLQNNDYGALHKELDKLGEDVRSTIRDIRTIIYDLKPSYLDDGLFSALENHILVYKENTGLDVKYKTAGKDHNVEYYIVSTVYRIAQEALTNISKHANATVVSVAISVSDGELMLKVDDNGSGFDLAALRQSRHSEIGKGFGVEGMMERIELVNGTMEIDSAPGKGTTIKITVPLKS